MKRKVKREAHFEINGVELTVAPRVRQVGQFASSWPRMDYILAVTIGALLAIGLMMVYSSTFDIAYQSKGQLAYYLIRQVLWGGLGLTALVVLARLDYSHLRRVSIPFMGLALVLLVLVLFVGSEVLGAKRTLFNGSVQPSELTKLAVVIYIADWLASKGEKIRDVSYGLIPFGVLIGLVAGLIVLEPDFSTAALIVLTASVMFFLAGAELVQMLAGGAIAALTFGLLIMNSAHAKARVVTFIGTILKGQPMSWQLQNALIAIGSGGLFGRGLGTSRQKLGYLPLAHTDSIFAIIGEELGLVGGLIVIGLFAVLAYRGFKIAAQASDTFGALLAAGVTSWLVLQAAFNVAAVIGLLPFTGIPLPFISYGGSALAMTLAAVGVLLSVSRGTRQGMRYSATLDFGRRDRRPRLSRPRSR